MIGVGFVQVSGHVTLTDCKMELRNESSTLTNLHLVQINFADAPSQLRLDLLN